MWLRLLAVWQAHSVLDMTSCNNGVDFAPLPMKLVEKIVALTAAPAGMVRTKQ